MRKCRLFCGSLSCRAVFFSLKRRFRFCVLRAASSMSRIIETGRTSCKSRREKARPFERKKRSEWNVETRCLLSLRGHHKSNSRRRAVINRLSFLRFNSYHWNHKSGFVRFFLPEFVFNAPRIVSLLAFRRHQVAPLKCKESQTSVKRETLNVSRNIVILSSRGCLECGREFHACFALPWKGDVDCAQ